MDVTNTKVLGDTAQPVQTNPYSGGGVGLAQKESQPSGSLMSEGKFLNPPGEKVRPPEEAEKASFEAASERPSLPEEHKKIGIQQGAESTQVATNALGADQFPMTESEAREHLKTSKPNDSIFGLAMVVIREIHKRILNSK